MLSWVVLAPVAWAVDFQVSPPKISFERNFEQAQLLVTAVDATGAIGPRADDLTTRATFVSSNPAVVTVTPAGRLLGVGNGDAQITVAVEGHQKTIEVHVEGIQPDPPINFIEQVLPILYKAGCNGGACHASQHGKGGFTLSVMGYDPAADRQAILRDRMQRRVNLLNPADSLVLKKPTMAMPHGGGKRLEVGSNDYNILQAWIARGAPESKPDTRKVTKLMVTPASRIGQPGMKQQLQVQALYSDGKTRDVTAWARFDSMDEGVLNVSSAGVVSAIGKGQAPIMVRYEGQAEIAMVVIPFGESVNLADWKNNNFVDELASAKFRELGIAPSGLCDDATFLRRAYFDAIGTQPT
ncbi:MAG: S-layer related protein (Precursor), partial [Planctomycetes bacterium]|nr:S-layer related protein (Precursor) [Planctomycetota bacterium]